MKKNKKIFFGSGGSSNIIIIEDNVAIKIIPDFKKYPLSKIKSDNDKKEIEFYKFLTKNFLLKEITPHFVGYYSNYKLMNIKDVTPKKCLSFSEKLLTNPNKIDHTNEKLCQIKEMYNDGLLQPKADIVILENCETNIEKEIEKIILKRNPTLNLIEFIHRTIFQFLYTMACVQKLYPRFIHNDMFLRNILGVNESSFNEDDYVEYRFDDISYYLPANGFYLKINDFGYSLNPPHIVSTLKKQIDFDPKGIMTIDDPKKDIYTFLFDYYDGQELGTKSIMHLIEKKKDNVKKLVRSAFKNYINVNTIDKINKINRPLLGSTWNIKDVDVLQKCVLKADKYFAKGIFKRFTKKHNDWNIVKTFTI